MATNNTDLFSYLPGLEVTSNEVLEAELAAQQILKAKFPDLDMREGTALRDLVIRPSATLLALVNKALVFYFQQNTIDGITDSTPQAFVDKILSNWFLTRKLGRTSVINVRLYFAKAKNIVLYPDIYFSTDGKLKFSPLSSMSFSVSQLAFDAGANQYYIDVDLVAAAAGKSYNITAGSLLYFTNFDPYFLHGEINYLKETAEDIETNSQFLTRAKSAISTRNLINVPSISSNLLEYFTMLDGVYPVGMGGIEMTRDQIQVVIPGVDNPIWIHNGGCVDVYSRVPLSSAIIQLVTDDTGKVEITGSIYKIERSDISGGADEDTLPLLNLKNVTSLTRSGTTATVVLGEVHGYTNGQQVTIVGAVPMAYNGTFAISVVDGSTFTYQVASSDLITPASGLVQCGIPITYTTANAYWLDVITDISTRVGPVTTITIPNHGLMKYDRVRISDCYEPGYNSTFVVTDTPTIDTITITTPAVGAEIETLGEVTISYVDRMNDVGFSDRQKVVVDFGVEHADKTVSFVLYMHQNIDGIQDYLSDPEKRVLCADLLARGFNLTLLDVSITGYNGPAPNAVTATSVINNYLILLEPGQPFVMSDLLSLLYAAGIQTIQTPINVTYTKYWNDLFPNTTGTITDVLNPDDTTNVFVLNSLITTSSVIV